MVLGTNIISDLVASFSDTFGGRSKTYQEYMDRMYGLAREELSKQATTLGANCVLGISLRPGELSGKGVQMMTLMVTDTPVLIRTPQELESRKSNVRLGRLPNRQQPLSDVSGSTRWRLFSTTRRDHVRAAWVATPVWASVDGGVPQPEGQGVGRRRR